MRFVCVFIESIVATIIVSIRRLLSVYSVSSGIREDGRRWPRDCPAMAYEALSLAVYLSVSLCVFLSVYLSVSLSLTLVAQLPSKLK